MIDITTLKSKDLEGMFKVYDKWPQLAKESYESNLEPIDFHEIDHIVFCGMGGSGTLGDLFYSILSKSKIHVNVVKGYLLPRTVDAKTLVIATSVSGNTVETLTTLDSAKKTQCKTITFSAGGKLQDYCHKNKLEHRYVKQIHSPRSSFPLFLYSMLNVLKPIVPINEKDIHDSIKQIEVLSNQISSSNLTESNPAINLASWLSGIPVVYYPWGLESAAIRFKNSLQENSKIHVIIENVIESCHNGIVSWERSSDAHPILIQGKDDYIKTKERWKILKEYFEKNDIDYRDVFSIKGNILSKLIHLVYFLDYVSIFKAIISGIDPSPIKSIDFVKERISQPENI